MPLPRRPLKHVRRTILRALRRRFPAAQKVRQAERDARQARDLDRLSHMLADRPELQVQITCSGRTDGAGGQALSVISALAYADHHACRYVHTPFRSISHVKGDQQVWTRQWEEFFGFGHGEAQVSENSEVVPLRQFVRLLRRQPGYCPGPHTVVQSSGFGYREFSARDIGRLAPRLRAKYHSSDKLAIRLHRTEGAINVAIHVRRGDVQKGFFRYTPDEPILRTIAQLRAVFESAGRAATLNVYSEGTADQFVPYSKAGCVLHLSSDTFETFHNLVAADVLVSAYSAFSCTAAILSEGIIIAPSAVGLVRDRRLTQAADGSFDQARFIDMLKPI